jgi:hypothetical protein
LDASSSVASFETRLGLDWSSGCGTDGEFSRKEDAIDDSSFLHELISRYDGDGPVIANRGDGMKMTIQMEERKWNEYVNRPFIRQPNFYLVKSN